MELYKKYRASTFGDLVGNVSTVKALRGMVQSKNVPHAILLHGPSGCGKTTVARILRRALHCSRMDYQELNCANTRGIDTIRDIAIRMNLSPSANGRSRIWVLDEAHQMSKDGQNAALKILEDTPKHVYFILCTTEPNKIINTIKTRCCKLPMDALPHKEIVVLLKKVCSRAKHHIDDEWLEMIADVANGSARSALMGLEKVVHLSDEEDVQKALGELDKDPDTIELCRVLYKNRTWPEIATVLRGLAVDPESARYAVLGYMNAILTKKDDKRAAHIIDCFSRSFVESGKAGLTLACYNSR